MPAFLDLTGQSFGHLTVKHRLPSTGKHTLWYCVCDCGNEKSPVETRNLRGGFSTRCDDCVKKWRSENAHNASHRKSKTRAYKIWQMMKTRCTNPNYTHYEYYGGRGITVCERWTQSFEDFLSDMGEPPVGYTLDRKDSNGNYEPNNCRWASRAEQVRNRSNMIVLEYKGVRKLLIDWANGLGVPRAQIYITLWKSGTFNEYLRKHGLISKADLIVREACILPPREYDWFIGLRTIKADELLAID